MTAYREALPADLPFAIGTWSSNYKNSHYAGIVQTEDWPDVMHAAIGKILARPTTRTIVAFEPPAFLYGFIAGELADTMPVVHWIYVKSPYRKAGIARGLFAALGVDPAREFLYTCRTIACVRLADKIPLARFTPGAARYANYLEHRSDYGR
jgi:GNAT superfamily N-acetyltransferase